MKKLLVTGSSGMLGSNIIAEIGNEYEVFGTYRNLPNPAVKNSIRIDLTNSPQVESMINSVNPDYVVHCAALTNVDICEESRDLANQANVTATANLVSALKPKTRFVYISTDSVFDGRRGGYSETDTPSPVNIYAESKLKGEHLVESRLSNHVIIRTTIIGWNLVKKGNNFAEWVYESLRDKRPIKMFTDVLFCPVTATTLALLINKLLVSDFVGKLNIGARRPISKYDFGLLAADMFGFDKSLITAVSVDTFGFKAERPKNLGLNMSKAEGILGKMPTVEDELKVFSRKWESHKAFAKI